MTSHSKVGENCPRGYHDKSGNWVKYQSMNPLRNYEYMYKICEKCNKMASANLPVCGKGGSLPAQGKQAAGGYTYGDGGDCKGPHGCLCNEHRRGGNSRTPGGFSMEK